MRKGYAFEGISVEARCLCGGLCRLRRLFCGRPVLRGERAGRRVAWGLGAGAFCGGLRLGEAGSLFERLLDPEQQVCSGAPVCSSAHHFEFSLEPEALEQALEVSVHAKMESV
jgi:hypothetical protein